MIKRLKFFATKFSDSSALERLEQEINIFLEGPVELLNLKMSSSWDEGSELAIAIVYRTLPETLPAPGAGPYLVLSSGNDYPEFEFAHATRQMALTYVMGKLVGKKCAFTAIEGGPEEERAIQHTMKMKLTPVEASPSDELFGQVLKVLEEPCWVTFEDADGWTYESGYFIAQIGP